MLVMHELDLDNSSEDKISRIKKQKVRKMSHGQLYSWESWFWLVNDDDVDDVDDFVVVVVVICIKIVNCSRTVKTV